LASAAGIAIDNARLHEAMQQAILTRDHVMASVSHDLKNPIAAISGNLQVLDSRLERNPEAYSPDLIRSELQRIRRLVLSMSGFLDELVETMRLEIGGQVELHPAHVDLSDLAADVVAIVQPTTTNHQLRLSARRPVIGLWDGNRLERVILNVVSNAIKYSPGGGDIEIDVEQAGSEAVVAVTDHGIGISREDLERVFEPFRRGSNVGDISGTGLGLAGARRIVEMHQGSMAVESVEARARASLSVCRWSRPLAASCSK
jgi:signal transduction histidine kinase